tara:strand:+ start:133 stop:327 length:195 start_codon:yes stop_codon:yes gene_type:complete
MMIPVLARQAVAALRDSVVEVVVAAMAHGDSPVMVPVVDSPEHVCTIFSMSLLGSIDAIVFTTP